MTVVSQLVHRTIICEAKREDFEHKVFIMEEKCQDLKMALEDLRKGNATQSAREWKLQSTVNELRKSSTLTDSLQDYNTSSNAMVVVAKAIQQNLKPIPKFKQPLSISPSSSSLSFTTSALKGVLPSSSAISHTLRTTSNFTPLGSNTSSPSLQHPPRTMTLGMDNAQLTSRIRQLEMELIQTRTRGGGPSSTHSSDVHDDLLRELEDNRRELDYVKGVESRQRIDLL
jgi:hypothetical protein